MFVRRPSFLHLLHPTPSPFLVYLLLLFKSLLFVLPLLLPLLPPLPHLISATSISPPPPPTCICFSCSSSSFFSVACSITFLFFLVLVSNCLFLFPYSFSPHLPPPSSSPHQHISVPYMPLHLLHIILPAPCQQLSVYLADLFFLLICLPFFLSTNIYLSVPSSSITFSSFPLQLVNNCLYYISCSSCVPSSSYASSFITFSSSFSFPHAHHLLFPPSPSHPFLLLLLLIMFLPPHLLLPPSPSHPSPPPRPFLLLLLLIIHFFLLICFFLQHLFPLFVLLSLQRQPGKGLKGTAAAV